MDRQIQTYRQAVKRESEDRQTERVRRADRQTEETKKDRQKQLRQSDKHREEQTDILIGRHTSRHTEKD